jgi:hypothetical protein
MHVACLKMGKKRSFGVIRDQSPRINMQSRGF